MKITKYLVERINEKYEADGSYNMTYSDIWNGEYSIFDTLEEAKKDAKSKSLDAENDAVLIYEAFYDDEDEDFFEVGDDLIEEYKYKKEGDE